MGLPAASVRRSSSSAGSQGSRCTEPAPRAARRRPLGGSHLWESRKALRPGGKVVGYGLITSIRGDGLTASRPGRRQRFRGSAAFALYIAGGWLLPGRKRVVPYSIQTLKRMKPAWFREDFMTLLELLRQEKLKPLVADRLPLAEARHAHEILEKGGVTGKLVLVCAPQAPT